MINYTHIINLEPQISPEKYQMIACILDYYKANGMDDTEINEALERLMDLDFILIDIVLQICIDRLTLAFKKPLNPRSKRYFGR